MFSHNCSHDSLRRRTFDSLEAGQAQADGVRWLYKWSSGYGINSKQVELSRGRSLKLTTQHRNMNRISLGIKRTMI
ncbi:hypothetical protein TNCV_2073391 [Trichonephila clavipes]|uniref:Uncharacterized protein n=1 Tax=Trichonephila clavipes TaxID=2585209 RepID=A0A8X6R8P4_TRICX|nr:hypothetical protein TNCV_2073391 [Trichonephila clavipes]